MKKELIGTGRNCPGAMHKLNTIFKAQSLVFSSSLLTMSGYLWFKLWKYFTFLPGSSTFKGEKSPA